MVSICMLSCHQPVPSMRVMRERSRFFSSVRRLMNMSTCSACSLWYRKVTMRSFSLMLPSSRCTGSIMGVPSETTSTMRAFSSSELTASAMRALMRGLSTRGAGTGRGVLGGVGRTVGATVRGCAEIACSDATCSEVFCAEILCAGTVAVGSCSPNGSSLVCGNTQSVRIGEEAHYR